MESRSHVKARNTVIHSFVVSVIICCGFWVTASARWLVPDWMIHPPPLFPTNEWGVVTNGCQLGLRVPKFQFELGEEIVPAVILRNVGDTNVMYVVMFEHWDYEVIVKRADGKAVPYTDWWAGFKDRLGSLPIQSRIQTTLEPHQETPAASGWVGVSHRYKMDMLGDYIITVKRQVWGSTGWFDVLSNPVTVTIVAPSATKPPK